MGESSPPNPPNGSAARAGCGGWPITRDVEIREAWTAAEVEAAGRVTVAANAEFAPADPDGPFATSWARYLVEMADAAARAAQGCCWWPWRTAGWWARSPCTCAPGRCSGGPTTPCSGSWPWTRPPVGAASAASVPGLPGPGPAAGKRRMALHTTEWMATARAMYERAGFRREPEGDADLPGVTIIAYAADLEPAGHPELDSAPVGGPLDQRVPATTT